MKKWTVILMIVVAGSISAYGQTDQKESPAPTIELPQDSLFVTDSLVLEPPPAPVDTPYVPKFKPNEEKSLWFAILVPGLGQIYNQKYWKLPIIYGAVLGLTYGITWNGTKYTEYGKAYQDLMGNDPNAKSYMDFFPPGTLESSIDKEWLAKVLKNKKDYFRSNRDLCVLSMIIVYGVGILDAYVDSSLFGFDMSPNLAIKMAPTIIQTSYRVEDLAIGLNCSIRF